VNSAEALRFTPLEQACVMTYPHCGCPAGPAHTDTGEIAADPGTIKVKCANVGPTMLCRTYVNNAPP
jgi:hypothetical protein